MIKQQYIINISLAAAVLCLSAGCSTDEMAVPKAKHDTEIVFSTARLAAATTTRAGAADTYNDALTAGSDIGVYIYGYEGATGYDISQYQPSAETPSKTWVYQTVGEAVTVSGGTKESNLTLTSHPTAPKFPSKVSGNGSGDMDHVEISAIFPNNTSFKPSDTSYTFTVDLNQTDETKIKAADLMTNDKVSYTKTDCDGKSLQLNLKHRMAKLHVTFVPRSGSDLTAANMPTNFKVLGVRRSVTVNPKAGTVVRDDTQDATTESSPMLGTTSHSFFIPPQTINADNPFLKFDIKGSDQFRGIKDCTFAPSANVTFAEGTSYEITVTLDVDYVGVTSTITSWTEEDMPFDPVVL